MKEQNSDGDLRPSDSADSERRVTDRSAWDEVMLTRMGWMYRGIAGKEAS